MIGEQHRPPKLHLERDSWSGTGGATAAVPSRLLPSLAVHTTPNTLLPVLDEARGCCFEFPAQKHFLNVWKSPPAWREVHDRVESPQPPRIFGLDYEQDSAFLSRKKK